LASRTSAEEGRAGVPTFLSKTGLPGRGKKTGEKPGHRSGWGGQGITGDESTHLFFGRVNVPRERGGNWNNFRAKGFSTWNSRVLKKEGIIVLKSWT